MSLVIKTENLGRHFGDIKAVDGISFEVGKGDVLGFLGPNGAGKSTTMRMLTCFLTPSFGRASICGHDIAVEPRLIQSMIGYLPENAPLYGEMEVVDLLQFVLEVRGVPRELRKAALDRAIQLTSLERVLRQRVETLSRGYKRRVGLAQALIHDPEILILDEPTDGLDPNQKHEVRELIQSMAKEKCIILSTHILEEVDAVCNRAIIIAQGKIVADSTPEELRRRSERAGSLTIGFSSPVSSEFSTELKKLPGVSRVLEERHAPGSPLFTIYPAQGQDVLRTFLREADARHWPFSSFQVDGGQLDDVFRSLTREASAAGR